MPVTLRGFRALAQVLAMASVVGLPGVIRGQSHTLAPSEVWLRIGEGFPLQRLDSAVVSIPFRAQAPADRRWQVLPTLFIQVESGKARLPIEVVSWTAPDPAMLDVRHATTWSVQSRKVGDSYLLAATEALGTFRVKVRSELYRVPPEGNTPVVTKRMPAGAVPRPRP